MPMRGSKVGVFGMVVLGLLLIAGSSGLSLCNMNDGGLTACKPSVTQPNPVEPSASCCEALSGADLQCLCSYKNSFLLPSLGIDPELALALPTKCNLTSPPNC
ncbi:putative lipid-transfer protein DIR1 [Capsicum chinense]|uniref:putative lipid-transfer protein DIR1 n=1 Tax=Capsicum annuum TaxID=4072 RepID=UPI000C0CFD4E|nr:putative lipid-transfer protein DIR1 [Capsicum annuum]KAF3630993.1 putative lipid-transfer protein DIR1 [Capsicum annuum]PHU30788.1 putative lipid-transfer protein DIR1 [Capsicum chinense]